MDNSNSMHEGLGERNRFQCPFLLTTSSLTTKTVFQPLHNLSLALAPFPIFSPLWATCEDFNISVSNTDITDQLEDEDGIAFGRNWLTFQVE